MASDRLYALAVQYKKTKLWQKLTDDALFGLHLSNGKIGYCSVMGMRGEHIALGVYIGEHGLATYRGISDISYEGDHTEMDAIFATFSQDSLQCAFEYKDELLPGELEEARDFGRRSHVAFRGHMAYPRFLTIKPYFFPFPIHEPENEQLLAEVLEAGIEVGSMFSGKPKLPKGIQFTQGEPYDRKIPVARRGEGGEFLWSMEPLPAPVEIPPVSPKLSNELLAVKMKRMKKKGELLCDLCMIPTPTAIEEGSDVYSLPVLLIALNEKDGMVLPSHPVVNFLDTSEELLKDFAETLMHKAKSLPRSLLVRNDRTYAVLEKFCQQAGIQLLMEDDEDRMGVLDDVEDDLLAHMAAPEDEQGDLAAISFVVEMLEHCSESELKNLPPILRNQIEMLMDTGVLPAELEKRLKKIFR